MSLPRRMRRQALAALLPLATAACSERSRPDAFALLESQGIDAAECAGCHGAKLEGQADWQTRRPDGDLPASPHDASGHTWHHPTEQLFAIVMFGMVPPSAPERYGSDMPAQVPHDLLPLLEGNVAHIAALRQVERKLDIERRAWCIFVGRGFDWLHLPNQPLIIGPYSPALDHPIRQAAGIIRANMHAGRIADDGFLLMSSVPYEDIGVDRARAALESRFLVRFAAGVIRREFTDLGPRLSLRESVINGHH